MMIFQILSALLHFGNVKIHEKDAESSDIPVSNYVLTLFYFIFFFCCITFLFFFIYMYTHSFIRTYFLLSS